MIEQMKNIQSMEVVDSNERRTAYKCGSLLYIEAPAGSILADHTHEESERLWILSGEGELIIGEEFSKVGPITEVHVPSKIYHKLTVIKDITFIEQRIKNK